MGYGHFGNNHFGNGHYVKRPLWGTAILKQSFWNTSFLTHDHSGNSHSRNGHFGMAIMERQKTSLSEDLWLVKGYRFQLVKADAHAHTRDFMPTYVHVCVRASVYECVHAGVHGCLLCVRACVYLSAYVRACTGACPAIVCACVRVCMRACVHTCEHAYVRADPYTHTCVCVNNCVGVWCQSVFL